MLSTVISTVIIVIFINSTLSTINNQTKINNQLNLDIDYRENYTILLFYNITSNYSYFITFRSFGHEQLKFGLFSSTNRSQKNSLEIYYPYSTTESFHLFIVCFHFFRRFNKLDVRCKDFRILNEDQPISDEVKDFLPAYNPLFVPLMYALSVLMLLPVIIQHHRRKEAQSLQRQKQLKRLSITIAQDNSHPEESLVKKILSQFAENGAINYRNIPMDVELISVPSTKTMLDLVDDNAETTTTIPRNVESYIADSDMDEYNQQTSITAHDSVAHLLDQTPWTTPQIDEPVESSLSTETAIRDCARMIKEPYVSSIAPLNNDDDPNQSNDFESKKLLTRTKLSMVNKVFLESDV